MEGLTGLIGIGGIYETNSYAASQIHEKQDRTVAFDALLDSAAAMINETNDLSNAAEEEEIKYALGQSESTHDLEIAQEKASIALQYTVSVRNTVLDAYKELMNLQF